MNNIKGIQTTNVASHAMASPTSSNNTVNVGVKSSGNDEGYLELILGPMFSGKTSTLKKIYDQ
jgi:hypothetical protein